MNGRTGMIKSNITMKDIAQHLSIDRTTVSKALSGHSGVSQQTVERVKKAAEELGYQVDSFASGLMTGKNSVLGIILADISRGAYAPFVEAFQTAARERHYGVILHYVNAKNKKKDFLEAIKLLKQQRVPGATFISRATSEEMDPYLIEMAESGMAIATTGRQYIHRQIDSITFDNEEAGYRLTRHLIGQGHTNIMFITYQDPRGARKGRMDGYMSAMREAGLEPLLVGENIQGGGTPGEEVQFAYRRIKRMWGQIDPPSAVIGGNDNFALGVMHALKELGVDIPVEVSIAGFDDLHAVLGVPQITSMRMPVQQAGHLAIELLIKRMEQNGLQASSHQLKYDMILRESTAPLRLIV